MIRRSVSTTHKSESWFRCVSWSKLLRQTWSASWSTAQQESYNVTRVARR